MKKIILFISVVSFEVTAAPDFHCYSVPSQPVQTYEYGSSNCGKNKKSKEEVGKDGERDILCMYQAGCMPVSGEAAKKEPPYKKVGEVSTMFMMKQLKPSILVCKGKGKISGGEIVNANCPTETQCRRDVFYNFMARSYSSGLTEPTLIKSGGGGAQ